MVISVAKTNREGCDVSPLDEPEAPQLLTHHNI